MYVFKRWTQVQRAVLYLQPDADLTAVDYRKLFRDARASENASFSAKMQSFDLPFDEVKAISSSFLAKEFRFRWSPASTT